MFSPSTNKDIATILTNQPKNHNGIDLIKFLCAIMVFIIHIPLFQGEVSGLVKYINFGLQHYLCRLAVPFYFVASGFFLFKKMPLYELNTDAIKNYCFKILRLLGIWNILLFFGGTDHLWYLGATVIAITLLSLCLHFRIKFRYICVFACLLYIIGLLGDSYYGIIEPLSNFSVLKYIFKAYDLAFQTTRNGVFMGFIFILMGAIFAHHKVKLKQQTALTGFIVSMLCLFAEVFLLKYNDIPIQYNMYVFLLPAVFFLFSFAYTVQLKDHAIFKHLRGIGLLIYFSHLFINKIVDLAISVIDKYLDADVIQFQFIITLTFTILFAVCIETLSCKNKFKWLKWFLS